VRRAEELLTLPVRVNGIQLGRPVDLIVDRSGTRAVGFDVRCGDDVHRFLPFAAAAVVDDAIEVQSPLVLLDFAQVSFYRERGTTLRALGHDGDALIADDGSFERAVGSGRR
jgi:hypothetical protein